MDHPPRVALALGSGGARGYAHIGAIQAIEEWGFDVVSIAGSSMGALVGGLYAADALDGYTAWVRTLSRFDVVRLLDASISSPGVIRAEKIIAHVRELADGARIEALPIPFTAVATDLAARKAVWFQRGPLDVAIRASIAIPGVFTPVMLNGRILVDGGLMDPVPIAPTAAERSDITIAIDLGGRRTSAAPVHETADEEPSDEWFDRFKRSASHLMDRDVVRAVLSRFDGGDDEEDPDLSAPTPSPEEVFEKLPSGLSRFDVMNQSLEAMQAVLTRYRLAGSPADVVVTIPKDACSTLDFHRANEMIELGYELTADAFTRAGLERYVAPPPVESDTPPG